MTPLKKNSVDRRFSLPTLAWLGLSILGYLLITYLIASKTLKMSYQIAFVGIGINIILAASLNLILGVAGQFSLGHAGFMSIGAYSAAITMQSINSWWGFILGILVGIAITVVVALIVSIPTLRLKGDYLAIATLGVAEIIRIVITNMQSITNGAIGISGIPRFTTLPMVYIVCVVVLYLLTALRNSRFGRAWNGVQEDEIASASVGVNVTKNKVWAFIIGASIASVAGSMYASFNTSIQPSLFDFSKSVDILVIVVLGGLGSFTGTVVSAVAIGTINLVFQKMAESSIIIYSIILIVMMIFRPKGLLGNKELSLNKLLKRRGNHEPAGR